MCHPQQHVPHTYHTVLHKRLALLFTHRRPEPWLDSFGYINDYINPLNAELHPICHLLALLGGATIVVDSRLRVNAYNYKGTLL